MKITEHRVARRLLIGLAFAMPVPVFAAAPPNILFLLADDLGWADLACYGSTFHETPALDQLAREGMRFTTFYTAGSVCSPTRSSIMTGKYPPRTGITDWIPGQNSTGRKLVQLHPRNELALEELTIAEALKAAGYQTFYTGKWHLGGQRFLPTDQGFDEYVGDEEAEKDESGGQVARQKRRLESTERFTKASLDFLQRRDQTNPFLLFLAYHDVHTPIQPMPGLVERYEKKAEALPGETPVRTEHEGQTRMRQDNPAYGSMLAAVDQSVAQLRRKLAELGVAENTMVVFTSDNGGLSTLKNTGPTCNSPLRAGKGWLYEGGIRAPLIMRVPGATKAVSGSDAPLISCDFYPTLLELAGLPARPQQHLDGVSFAGLLRGGAAPATRPLFWHYPHYHGSTWTPGAALRDGDWKLIEFYDYGTAELYDLKNDPFETKDLAPTKPEKKRELLDKLHAWQKSVGAQMPLPDSSTGGEPSTPKKKKKRKQA
jgi:arylsulfatase A-like enzyme